MVHFSVKKWKKYYFSQLFDLFGRFWTWKWHIFYINVHIYVENVSFRGQIIKRKSWFPPNTIFGPRKSSPKPIAYLTLPPHPTTWKKTQFIRCSPGQKTARRGFVQNGEGGSRDGGGSGGTDGGAEMAFGVLEFPLLLRNSGVSPPGTLPKEKQPRTERVNVPFWHI